LDKHGDRDGFWREKINADLIAFAASLYSSLGFINLITAMADDAIHWLKQLNDIDSA
jgi:hypothetical protein